MVVEYAYKHDRTEQGEINCMDQSTRRFLPSWIKKSDDSRSCGQESLLKNRRRHMPTIECAAIATP